MSFTTRPATTADAAAIAAIYNEGIVDRVGTFETEPRTPEQIVAWFVQRWQLETTFEEARAHLGLETQRQWNDLAIARTTPILLGLFSFVTLLADRLHAREGIPVRQAAWYVKELPTFSDALAAVRRELWRYGAFSMSPDETPVEKLPLLLLERFGDLLCYAQ